MARRKDGKMDRRTAEYRDAAARMAAARAALKKERSASKPAENKAASGRRADGQVDQRTREGRAMAARMEAVRAKRGGRKGFFAWLFGG